MAGTMRLALAPYVPLLVALLAIEPNEIRGREHRLDREKRDKEQDVRHECQKRAVPHGPHTSRP